MSLQNRYALSKIESFLELCLRIFLSASHIGTLTSLYPFEYLTNVFDIELWIFTLLIK
jgi:hypothetical protein